jgi:hypothetical protein
VKLTDDEAKAVRLLSAWWLFCEAGAECDGEPLEADLIAVSYSGNGASCFVQVCDVRAGCRVLDRILIEATP